MNYPYISLKISEDGGKMIRRTRSHKIRRIYSILKVDKFSNCVFDVTVTYQKGWTNSGIYETKKDLIFALKAFLEKE